MQQQAREWSRKRQIGGCEANRNPYKKEERSCPSKKRLTFRESVIRKTPKGDGSDSCLEESNSENGLEEKDIFS